MTKIYKPATLILAIIFVVKLNSLAQTELQKIDKYLTPFSSSEIKNESFLNSPDADFSPVFYDGKLIFISDRAGAGKKHENNSGKPETTYCKLYSALKDPATDQEEIYPACKELDLGYHNGPVVFSKENDMIFFTRTKMVRKKQNATIDPTSWVNKTTPEYVNHLEIYSATRNGEKWDNLKPFVYNNPGTYSVGHPALSPDGNMLYFVSDMPGGFGETDIYFCEKGSDGLWGMPVNSGKEINTAGKEAFPVISEDGTLYFSSDGHPGYGGLDLFSANGAGNAWVRVSNLEQPVNSSKDDFGITFDSTGTSGYFSSDREGGAGSDDIYFFNLKEPDSQSSCALSGLALGPVNDLDVDEPFAGALVQFYKEGEASPADVYSNAEGRFFFNIEQGVKYEIKGLKGGYLARIDAIIAVCKSSSDSIDLVLKFKPPIQDAPAFEKAAFAAISIYYDLNKANIKPNAAKELDKIVKALQDDPQVTIELNAHADSRASDEYNMVLSEQRAESAINYLVSKGINRNRIIANSYGKSQLVNHCIEGVDCPEKYHRENRRAELKIIHNYLEVKKQ